MLSRPVSQDLRNPGGLYMSDERPNLWPIGIVGGLLAAITCLLVAASFLIRNPVELVRKDYYDADGAHQKKVQAMAAGQALTKQPDVKFWRRHLNVYFPDEWVGDVTKAMVRVYRPDDAAQDLMVLLEQPEEGLAYPFEDRPRGRWKIEVVWSMSNTQYVTEHELYLK